MLHLVLKAEPDERQNSFRFWPVFDCPQKAQHLFVDVFAISDRLPNCRARTGAALWPRYSFTKAFIVGVEIKEILFGIDFVAGLIRFQQGLEKPGRVPDVPAWRTHELRGLYH